MRCRQRLALALALSASLAGTQWLRELAQQGRPPPQQRAAHEPKKPLQLPKKSLLPPPPPPSVPPRTPKPMFVEAGVTATYGSPVEGPAFHLAGENLSAAECEQRCRV